MLLQPWYGGMAPRFWHLCPSLTVSTRRKENENVDARVGCRRNVELW